MQKRKGMSLRDAKMIWRGRDAYQWECHWRTFRGMTILLIATAVAMPYASPGKQGIALAIFVGSILALYLLLAMIRKGLRLLGETIATAWKGPDGKPSP
jgi:hypothetical protein